MMHIPLADPSILYVTFRGILIETRDQGKTWTKISVLPSQYATDLESDPQHADRLYLGSYVFDNSRPTVADVLKSTDGGSTWKKQLEVTGRLMSLAVDPETPNRIYALHDQGLHLSTDAGITWLPFGSNVRKGGQDLTIDPYSPATLYAMFGGVFKSTDKGSTWKSRDCPCGPLSMAVDPAHKDTVYVTGQGGGGYSFIFQSRDGAATWRRLELPPMNDFNPFYIAAGSGSILASALGNNGVVRSVNSGAGWSLTYRGTGGLVNELKAGEGSTMWSLGLALFRSQDSGRTWAAQGKDFPTPSFYLSAFDVSAIHPATLGLTGYTVESVNHVTHWLGTTRDNGSTWTFSNIDPYPRQIVMDPKDENVIYLRYWHKIEKSGDFGKSWTTLSERFSARQITSLAADSLTPQHLFVGTTGFRVYVSADAGATWRVQQLPIAQKTTSTDVYKLIPAGTGSTVYALARFQGVHRSTDNGTTWQISNKGLPLLKANEQSASLELQFLSVDPRNSNTIYTGGSINPDELHSPAFFISHDAGVSWQLAPSAGILSPFSPVTELIFLHSDPRSMFLSSYSGIYRSFTP